MWLKLGTSLLWAEACPVAMDPKGSLTSGNTDFLAYRMWNWGMWPLEGEIMAKRIPALKIR